MQEQKPPILQVLVLAIAFAVVLLLLPKAPPKRMILFQTNNADGVGEGIHTLDIDSGRITNLTPDSQGACCAMWSPSGRKIAYMSMVNDGAQIYIMDVDDRNKIQLTKDNFGGNYPIWSPDGKRIAFVCGRDGDWEICTINVDGSNESRLTQNTGYDIPLFWLPESEQLFFYSDREAQHGYFLMNADGSDQHMVISAWETNDVPVWSPDGRQLAVSTQGSDSLLIMIIDRETNNRHTFKIRTTPKNLVWSPDSKQIAFKLAKAVNGAGTLYAVNADGSNLRRLTDDEANATSPQWSADGKYIVYVKDAPNVLSGGQEL